MNGEELIRLFGLDGVVYHPWVPGSGLHRPTAEFLSAVGLPTDGTFVSRAEPENSSPVPRRLGPLLDHRGRACPPERRAWLVLGYLVTGLVVLDPLAGTVHSYPEGEEEGRPLHRDVQSFVLTLCAFRRLLDACAQDEDEDSVEEHARAFRSAVTAVDPLPLADPGSEWNRLLDEVLEGMW
ncbi:hypothetical protein GCM10010503_64430 [Streptomyces lucensis JCM 4490]|uniref:SUKH-4 immunity protein of toxin-antitoxin system n=1 Tax=Streptomyces lucensis JCM 4490 TaxID=1306176 RepID=A0A918MVV6_9ACTN|nr:SUKH-4 family immunity protein [Streptomyces lucensis]GGW77725.1 hypothetical protein GCM10010503_64430 [Streptomyces lucensis JCM 4490]